MKKERTKDRQIEETETASYLCRWQPIQVYSISKNRLLLLYLREIACNRLKELEAGKLGRFQICFNDYNGLKVTLSVGCFQEVIYDIKTLMPKPLWLLCSSGHYLEVAVNSGLTVL